MIEALKLLQAIEGLHIDPMAAVIVAGLLVAWLEQKMARNRTPPFTSAHTGLATPGRASRRP